MATSWESFGGSQAAVGASEMLLGVLLRCLGAALKHFSPGKYRKILRTYKTILGKYRKI